MAILTKPVAKSFHWYHRDGRPQHTVPDSDGNERGTHLGDARKMGLFPSVSTILGILAKSGLELWKHRQIALAAFRLIEAGKLKVPAVDLLSEAEAKVVANAVLDEAFKQVEDAANLGKHIHRESERFWRHDWSGKFEPDASVAAYIGPALDWMIAKGYKVENPEKVVVNPEHGYAGTTDIPFRFGTKGIGILDFKSKKTKPGEPVDYFDTQPTQIAAYGAAYWGEAALANCWGINLYVSTTEPGRVDAMVYKPQMLVAEFEMFKNLCAIWRHLNQYDPRIPVDQPQPAFYSGQHVVVSQPLPSESVPESLRKVEKPSVAQLQQSTMGAFDTAPKRTVDQDLVVALFAAGKGSNVCDGIEFLKPEDCIEMAARGTKVKTVYSWYVATDAVRISLKNDGALKENGWHEACPAYAKSLDQIEQAAGKPAPATGTNGLPVKPIEGGTKSGVDFSDKEKLAKAKAQRLKDESASAQQEAKQKAAEVELLKNPPKPTAKIAYAAALVTLEAHVLGFGKHKGEPLGKVPDGYLKWLAAPAQASILKSQKLVALYLSRPDVRKALKIDNS